MLYVKKEIKKGQRFILNGIVESTWLNAFNKMTMEPLIWDISDFGIIYHEKFYKNK